MNYESWNMLQDRALQVIDEYAEAGIHVPSSRREALTTLQRVDYLRNRARAADARYTKETEHSGSAPEDNLKRATTYESQGDLTRALDSYRAAASGYASKLPPLRTRRSVTRCLLSGTILTGVYANTSQSLVPTV